MEMHKRSRRAVLSGIGTAVLAGVGGLPGSVSAASDVTTTATEKSWSGFPDGDRVESVVDDIMESRIGLDIPGATVAVVDSDDVLLTKGYGQADLEEGTPVRAGETTFRVGSVCKLVTWTAVMQGVEDGRLDLDEDINEYLRDSPVEIPATYDDPVTLRGLGTHTAGFDFVPNPGIVRSPDELTSLSAALVQNQPDRVRPPGAAVGYSNYGAMLAGHVVAQAYDTTFEEYVRSEIFDPLGMDHSTFAQPVPTDRPGTLASPHAAGGDSYRPADPVYINWRPAGSMSATATDMAAFMRAHLNGGAIGDGRILQQETVATMHSQHYRRHPAVNNWRYGFYEYGHPDGSTIAHSGGTVHYTSWLGLVPQHDVGIFVNYNVKTTADTPSNVGDELIQAFDLQPTWSSPSPTSEPRRRERAETVAGEYRTTMAPQSGPLHLLDTLNRINVELVGDGRLMTPTLGGNRKEWVETDPYLYRATDGQGVLAFEVENGSVQRLHMNSYPQTTLQPVPLRERQLVTGGMLAGGASGFLLSLTGLGGLRAWRAAKRRLTDTDDGDDPTSQFEDGPEEGAA